MLQKIREKLDDVTVVLMYIHACEETVYQRAVERGHNGRAVSPAEVADSLEKLPRALQKLLPYTDSFIQVNNNFDEPQVTSVCQQLRGEDTSSCQVSEDIESMGEVGWSGVSGVLQQARGGEPAEPLPEPPAILPASGSSQPKPMSTLFHTIAFAATKHKHQTRKNPQKTPYINHPLAVARILAEVGIRDLPTLQAALLHDTLEDQMRMCSAATMAVNTFGLRCNVLGKNVDCRHVYMQMQTVYYVYESIYTYAHMYLVHVPECMPTEGDRETERERER